MDSPSISIIRNMLKYFLDVDNFFVFAVSETQDTRKSAGFGYELSCDPIVISSREDFKMF